MGRLAMFAGAVVITAVVCSFSIDLSRGTNSAQLLEERRIKFANGAQVDVKIIRPEGEGPYPAIIVLHGYPETVDAKYLEAMRHFAARNFIVVAPNFPGFASQSGRAGRVSDLVNEVSQWPQVKADKIGAWGFAAGAAVALLTAGKNEKVRAVAACGAPYGELDKNVIVPLEAPVFIQHGTQDGPAAARQYERQRREVNKPVRADYADKGHCWDVNQEISNAAAFFAETLK